MSAVLRKRESMIKRRKTRDLGIVVAEDGKRNDGWKVDLGNPRKRNSVKVLILVKEGACGSLRI